MIAATYTEGVGLSVAEIPRPRIRAGEVLVRVQATAICGTDVKIIRAGHRKLKPGRRLVLGHEFAGTIEEAGSDARTFPVGTRVGVAPNFGCGGCEACVRGMANMCPEYSAFGINVDGSHAAYVRIPPAALAQGNLVRIPDAVPWEEAALAEPLSCALNGQRAAGLKVGESVLIYGAGPMGLLHVLLAAATGAAAIHVADPVGGRLRRAGKLGATRVLRTGRDAVSQSVLEETEGRGVDVVIAAVPAPEVVEEALSLLAPFGRLCLFAGLPRERPMVRLDANMIHYKNLVVTGTTGGSTADYRAAVRLISARRVDVRGVISHVFPMSRLREAYDVALSGKGLKVIVTGEG